VVDGFELRDTGVDKGASKEHAPNKKKICFVVVFMAKIKELIYNKLKYSTYLTYICVNCCN
jgi:hypothetical protein